MQWWRAWGPWVIFTVLGPPLGLLALLIPLGIASGLSGDWPGAAGPAQPSASFPQIMKGMLGAFSISYLFGVIQATFVGMIASVYRNENGNIRLMPPMIAAFIVSIFVMFLVFSNSRSASVFELYASVFELFYVFVAVAVTHCVPTGLCWFIARNLRSFEQEGTQLQ